jgi:hypothetical protein
VSGLQGRLCRTGPEQWCKGCVCCRKRVPLTQFRETCNDSHLIHVFLLEQLALFHPSLMRETVQWCLIARFLKWRTSLTKKWFSILAKALKDTKVSAERSTVILYHSLGPSVFRRFGDIRRINDQPRSSHPVTKGWISDSRFCVDGWCD